MANEIGKLEVILEAQTAQFEKGMAQVVNTLKKTDETAQRSQKGFADMAAGMAKMAAVAAVTALAGMAKQLIDAADAASDTAVAFGTTIDKIYAYNQAMVEAGGKADVMDKALQKLADQVDSAFEGADSAVEAFNRLGISMDSIANKSLDEILQKVTKALEAETDAAKRNAIAKELLGKAMINVDYATFNQGVENAAEKYAHLAPLLQEAADASDFLAAKWKSLTTYLTAFAGAIFSTVKSIAQGFSDIKSVVTGAKTLEEVMTTTTTVMQEKAAPAIERVAKATAAQKKAVEDAKKAQEAYNKEMEKWDAITAKQVEAQIAWERALLDSLNPMNEIERQLNKLQIAMDSGRLTADQYAEGLFKIFDAGTNLAKIKDPIDEIGVAIGTSLSGAVGDLVDTFFDAGQSFSQFAQNFLTNIAKMITQMLILKAIQQSMKGTSLGSFFGFAKGGAFDGSTGLPYGVYDKPTLFPMPSPGLHRFATGGTFAGTGMLGEAGPEAILPLRRGTGGKLGVQAAPANTTINVINKADTQVQVSETNKEDGSKQIDILIEKKVKEMIAGGSLDKPLSTSYGLSRKGY